MLTSIIILTKNQLDYTKKCLDSIRKYTDSTIYELIIVDNFSNDGTREWLQQQQDIKLILNDENKGFPIGCNQGIEVASGENILLLNNDVVVTHNWLDNLLKCLYSAHDIGAVGPVTNSAGYYSTIPVDYKNLSEMQDFARKYNESNSSKWEQRVKLIGFCMLIKKEVIDQIGFLDERFTPGNYEDDDYSYRIQLANYRLMICKDTFIHHYGGTSFSANKEIDYSDLLKINSKKFERKWGFNSHYSSGIRFDVLPLIEDNLDSSINVLEVGCAAGATLLEIKNKFKNANVYGIEINENSAAISQKFIDVRADNIEKNMSYSENFFDYIIFADVLEHLYDPWSVLDNMRKYLKADGQILISIPNVMHHSVLEEVLNGGWEYQDAGLLDRTHIRFFTLRELYKMLTDASYTNLQFQYKTTNDINNKKVVNFIGKLTDVTSEDMGAQYKVYQYLVKANKRPDAHVMILKRIAILVENIELEITRDESILEIIDIFCENQSIKMDILATIMKYSIESEKMLQKLGLKSFELNQSLDIVLSYLYSAYELNANNDDTIFNISYILAQYNQYDEALQYLNQISDVDQEVQALKEYIVNKSS